mmetsp:Transcript_4768/g.8473  ORF Transcript_4768/g.8473 Transcript_4768/m.8473 type:complete len:102 (+) Transcript_4768:572-877(+)
MQRSVAMMARRAVARPTGVNRLVMKQQTAAFSVEGSDFEKRRKALEDQYFKELDNKARQAYSEALHEKELKSLLDILPKDHNLSSDALHNILVWKHKDTIV